MMVHDLHKIKNDIKKYFELNHGKIIDYIDLSVEFKYPLPVLVEACEALVRDGKIVEAG